MTRIANNTQCECTMVCLASSLVIIGHRSKTSHTKYRHELSLDPTVGSPTHIDAIGIPRGVTDEHKLVDQIAAGFENIPIIQAMFPISPSKNVARINYVHYNFMRLANLTRNTVEELTEQLALTSLISFQKWMALDMLLAEKGDVCSMFGDVCCTFIPNNTAPDRRVTKALEGLRTLSREMSTVNW